MASKLETAVRKELRGSRWKFVRIEKDTHPRFGDRLEVTVTYDEHNWLMLDEDDQNIAIDDAEEMVSRAVLKAGPEVVPGEYALADDVQAHLDEIITFNYKLPKKTNPFITREGKLGGPGYTRRPAGERHKILRSCEKEYGYKSCLNSIQALLLDPALTSRSRSTLEADKLWLMAQCKNKKAKDKPRLSVRQLVAQALK